MHPDQLASKIQMIVKLRRLREVQMQELEQKQSVVARTQDLIQDVRAALIKHVHESKSPICCVVDGSTLVVRVSSTREEIFPASTILPT